jgi:hypothetical protein
VRLLVVHNGDSRLAALESLLSDLGYDAVVLAGVDEGRALLDREGPPDVLVTTHHGAAARAGMVFARECLARFPNLRALYVAWLPWPSQPPLVPRERVLPAPFSAARLADAIAAGGPAGKSAIVKSA